MKKIYNINVNGKGYEVHLEEVKEVAGSVAPTQATPTPKAPTAPAPSTGGAKIEAPMPGSIVDIKVSQGATVKSGDVVAILEAMKMETEILAPVDGVVDGIHVDKGGQVNLGDAIITLK